jgi:hypothetical protein
MEQQYPNEAESRVERAKQFLADNSPLIEEFDSYLEGKQSEVKNGQSVWCVTNIDHSGNTFDFFARNNYFTAKLTWDTTEDDHAEVALYLAEDDAHTELSGNLSDFRVQIDPEGKHLVSTELQVMGYALEITKAYFDSKQ